MLGEDRNAMATYRSVSLAPQRRAFTQGEDRNFGMFARPRMSSLQRWASALGEDRNEEEETCQLTNAAISRPVAQALTA